MPISNLCSRHCAVKDIIGTSARSATDSLSVIQAEERDQEAAAAAAAERAEREQFEQR